MARDEKAMFEAVRRRGALALVLSPPTREQLLSLGWADVSGGELGEQARRASDALHWACEGVADTLAPEPRRALFDVAVLAACADGTVRPEQLRALSLALTNQPWMRQDAPEPLASLLGASARLLAKGPGSRLEVLGDQLCAGALERAALRLACVVVLSDGELNRPEELFLRELTEQLILPSDALTQTLEDTRQRLGLA